MAGTNTARSKHYLENLGWRCWNTEQTIRIPGQFGNPPRMFKRDMFNFADLCCFNVALGLNALVQTTSRSNQSSRIEKIKGLADADGWLRTQPMNRIYVHGWKKKKNGRWEVTITEIGLDGAVIPEGVICGVETPLFDEPF